MFVILSIVIVAAVLVATTEPHLLATRRPVRQWGLGLLGASSLGIGGICIGSFCGLFLFAGSTGPWLFESTAAAAEVQSEQALASSAADTDEPESPKPAEQPDDEPAEQPDNQPDNQPADEPAEQEPAEKRPIQLEREDGATPEPPAGATDPSELKIGEDGPQRVSIPIKQRPSWVDGLAKWDGELYTMPIMAGPHVDRTDCRRALQDEKKRAVERYINEYLKNPQASLFLRYDVDFINNRLVGPTHDEVITVSFGPMHQSHALLKFDNQFRAELDEGWRHVVAKARLAQLGLGAGAVLGLLALVFSYFKADTRTRGFYSGRLQFVAAVAILALIAGGVLIARWIPWI